MTLEEKIDKYRLNDEQREFWYENVLRQVFLSDTSPSQTRPVFTLLTAQPGSGKTTAAVRNARQTNPYPVRFGGDDIRLTLPYADTVMHEDADNYSFITRPDMSWGREKLVDECLHNHYNLQIDSILIHADDYKMGTIMRAKEHGYKIECVVLGVPDFLSMVSMYNRREQQILKEGVGFPVVIKEHDYAYDILPDVTAKMYDLQIADRVRVINRQFKEFYDTDKSPHPNGDEIKEAINQARQSYVQRTYLAYTNTLWKSIYQNMKRRGASKEHFSAADEQYHKFEQICRQNGLYNPQTDTIYQSKLKEKS